MGHDLQQGFEFSSRDSLASAITLSCSLANNSNKQKFCMSVLCLGESCVGIVFSFAKTSIFDLP